MSTIGGGNKESTGLQEGQRRLTQLGPGKYGRGGETSRFLVIEPGFVAEEQLMMRILVFPLRT
jgi:hypothetical protein